MKPKEVFQRVKRKRRNALTELESRQVLKSYKIPLVKGVVTRSVEEAIKFAKKNYPVVLKVVSKSIIHKTDVGGLVLDVENEKELREGYYQILKNVKRKKPGASVDGIFVQKMIKGGHEVMVGGKWDQTFGQTIAFGLGGVFVEVLDDVSFRIVPITKKDALEMMREIKSFKVLKGYRGKRPAHLKSLVNILMKTSKMLEENLEIKELDINPIFALPDKAIAVDARIIVE